MGDGGVRDEGRGRTGRGAQGGCLESCQEKFMLIN